MTDPRNNKTFDCVEIKRRGAETIRKELEGRTPGERLAYWQNKTNLLKQRFGKPGINR